MGFHIPNDAYAAYFDYFAACTRLSLTSDAETPANLNNELAFKALTAGTGGADYSVDDGDPTGRKLVVTAQNNVDATDTGTTRHAVLSLDGTIRLVTTCAERSLNHTNEDKVNMGSFELEVGAPTNPT